MRISRKLLMLALIAFQSMATSVPAESPMLSYIFPAGGQRGTAISARIGGCNLHASPKLIWSGKGVNGPSTLESTETIWFEGPVIPQPASQQKEDYPRDYAAPLVVAADAALGRVSWRMATSQGVTSALGFIIGEFPEIVEREEEGAAAAVAVTLPVTINGRIFPREDVDTWKFSAKSGQVVTCHVATSEFGSPLDARLVMTDANGRMLAESIPAGDITPSIRFTVPADGEYLVRIHDVSFQGLQNHVYRLTVTTGPVLDAVYPLGGRRGTATRLELAGANLVEASMTQTLPETGTEMIFRLPDPQLSFGQARLELDDLDELLETPVAENNVQTPFSAPCVLNGRIQSPGEEDVWPFRATKGLEYDLDVHASRCGSPLDAVLRLCDSMGRTIQEADDAPGLQTDARLRWSASDDGDYQIRVRDRLVSRGDKRFAYRVRVTSATLPEFKLKVAVDSVNIEQGQSVNVKIMVERGPGLVQPIELAFDGIPASVTIGSPMVIQAGQQEVQVTLKADKDASVTTVPIQVTGTAMIGDRSMKVFAATQPAIVPPGQDSIPIADVSSMLWLSVAIPTPFKFVGIFESKFVPRGAFYVRKYRIERNGFTGQLQVQLADRQGRHLQGVTARPVIVDAGQSDFEFAVELPPWMEVGRTCRSTLAVTGVTTDSAGQSHCISFSSNDQHNQMIALVAPGRLTIQLPQATVVARPAQSIELPVRIQRSPETVGPVTLELVGSRTDRGVSAVSATIDGTQSSGTLVLKFASELQDVALHPLTIRAKTLDERQLPVTAEAKFTVVGP